MKTCKTCKIEKDESIFGVNKYSADKLQYVCNPCRAEYELQRRISKGIIPKIKPIVVDEFHKECLICKNILHIEKFSSNTRGRLGRNCYCITCQPIYHLRNRESNIEYHRNKGKISTQKYRDTHREHWRSLHRINQFNRKNLIKANSDGTVSEIFMKSIYAMDKCHWCDNIIPKEQRTAEHIIPLINGGVHGITNITMACISCNSSKLNFKTKK